MILSVGKWVVSFYKCSPIKTKYTFCLLSDSSIFLDNQTAVWKQVKRNIEKDFIYVDLGGFGIGHQPVQSFFGPSLYWFAFLLLSVFWLKILNFWTHDNLLKVVVPVPDVSNGEEKGKEEPIYLQARLYNQYIYHIGKDAHMVDSRPSEHLIVRSRK